MRTSSLRRNQKGPGQSVAVDQLARRWEQKESDVVGALKECGLTIPESEEQDPEYFEFEGDLYWVNRNNRGQLFINSREKPRPVFRTVAATKLSSDDPATAELVAERATEKAEIEKLKAERLARQAAADAQREAARLARQQREAEQAARAAAGGTAATEAAPAPETKVLSGPLPPEAEILEKIRPQMRRNRRGPGYSGSISFLSRALGLSEAELITAFAALGLHVPAQANDKPVHVEIDGAVYWINQDGRGGIWINGREKRDGAPAPKPATPAGDQTPVEALATPAASSESQPVADAASVPVTPAEASTPPPSAEPAEADTSTDKTESAVTDDASDHPALTAVRLLLKPNKRGSGVSGEVGFLSRSLDKSEEAFLATLTHAGLVVPSDAEAKPVFVEQAGEIFWLNKNSTDGSLWLNAKAAKSAAKKPAGSSSRARPPRKSKPASKSEG
jgi:hypothetical protein